MTPKKPRPHGVKLTAAERARGIAMIRAGATREQIRAELNISDATITRWYKAADLPPPRPTTTRRKPVAKAARVSPVAYLGDQLAVIGRLIQTKLPELARFTLTITPDGKASVDYAVRQTTELAGTVRL